MTGRTYTVLQTIDSINTTSYLHNVLKEGGINTFPEYEAICPGCQATLRSDMKRMQCPNPDCSHREAVTLERRYSFSG